MKTRFLALASSRMESRWGDWCAIRDFRPPGNLELFRLLSCGKIPAGSTIFLFLVKGGSVKQIIFIVAAILAAASVASAADSQKYLIKLSANYDTCTEPAGGQSPQFTMGVTPTGLAKTVTVAPLGLVGTNTIYFGIALPTGFTAALSSRCTVTPTPDCTGNAETLTVIKDPATNKFKAWWIVTLRNEKNQDVCSTVYAGSAKKVQ